MKALAVRLTASAAADLDRIEDRRRGNVIEGIRVLASDPLPDGAARKKLKGLKPPLYRLRCGDHRLLYRIDSTGVIVMRVIDRKELEKTIRTLG